jgi:hypothetical protein
MKKVLSGFLCFIGLIGLISFTLVHAQVVAYPHLDTLKAGQTRYQIISGKELVDFAKTHIKTKTSRDAILKVIPDIQHLDLDGYYHLNLSDGVKFDPKAQQVWNNLVYWLPGNIVVGPYDVKLAQETPFNDVALSCLKTVIKDAQRIAIFEQWKNEKTTVDQKIKILIALAGARPSDAASSVCWKK